MKYIEMYPIMPAGEWLSGEHGLLMAQSEHPCAWCKVPTLVVSLLDHCYLCSEECNQAMTDEYNRSIKAERIAELIENPNASNEGWPNHAVYDLFKHDPLKDLPKPLINQMMAHLKSVKEAAKPLTYTVNGRRVQTKEQALKALCATANSNCLHIEHLWCYEGICKEWGITKDDYYNDEAALDAEHLAICGNDNWKPRPIRVMVVNTIDPDHDESYGFQIVEQLWDEMAGNYWGHAEDAPSKFDTEAEAQAWIDAHVYKGANE